MPTPKQAPSPAASGKALYSRYVRLLSEIQNCATDSWDALPEGDHDVWNALATRGEGIQLSWSNNCDIGAWVRLSPLDVIRVNEVDYVFHRRTDDGLELQQCDDMGTPRDDRPRITIPWPQVESLHIY